MVGPVRVLRNLAARWDTFAGDVALPPDTVAVLSDHVEVVDGDLRIIEHLVEPSNRDSPAGYLRGSVGTVRYRLADAHRVPAEIRRALDALAGFAEFAGFGDRTAMGMGYVPSAASGQVMPPTLGTARTQVNTHKPTPETPNKPSPTPPNSHRSRSTLFSQLTGPRNREP